ncbi:MAG TPA: hypothetical protein VMB50_15525, partial [Myxococcales bacterium]|nr:hypothetical protein [Myxococcales bacterium]
RDGGTFCTVTGTDDANCGACGTICPSAATCVSGECLCQDGSPPCGAVCCATGATCVNGSCGAADAGQPADAGDGGNGDGGPSTGT